MLKFFLTEHMTGQRQPWGHAHHAHLGGQRQRQHGGGRLQGGFGEGVAEKIRVLVPQLLVKQIHHYAFCIGLLGAGLTLHDVLVQITPQHNGRSGVAGHVLLQQGIGKILCAVVSKQGCTVDHRIQPPQRLHGGGHQCAGSGFVGQIGHQGAGGHAQRLAIGHGLRRAVHGAVVVHSHRPAGAGQVQGDFPPQAPTCAGDQYTRKMFRTHTQARDNAAMHNTPPRAQSVTSALLPQIEQAIAQAGGWLGFDRFMHLALYAPGLGYYANASVKLGQMPASGSDFVTAPELSPVFGQLLAAQVAEALQHTATYEVWEFGAGSGALAEQLIASLQAQGAETQRYTIVDVSGSLRARQQERLARFGDLVHWADQLPPAMQGVVVGNEVLDAMPVQLLARTGGAWHERGVALDDGRLVWRDRPTPLRPPLDIAGEHDYVTEIHAQGEAFIRTLGAHLERGAAFFIDYGFGEDEYYHPQRHMGTLVCHRLHQMDDDPLTDVGSKDITAHVNFTGSAVAAQDAGFDILGYTSQGHFLLNCGFAQKAEQLALAQRPLAGKLVLEHEMGELFKVLGLVKGAAPWPALGFSHGDRTHRL